jgi:23S rRNA pseudouridine1911/1915/1917 synthase
MKTKDLIAIDKPSGLLSVATEKEKGRTAYRLVSDYITQTNPKARIFVVHRLDEDTSGVLVFAKNWETREALQNSWQDIIKDRRYYAIVEGQMEKKEDTLRDYLDQDRAQLVYVTHNKEKGKLAITSYSVLAAKKEYSLLDVTIDSGRKNQIRVQLGNIGHYVIGDDKYGEPSNPLKRLGLHAYNLTFTNPLNGKEYTFTAPMPSSFKAMFFGKVARNETAQNPKPFNETPRPRYERKGLHARRHHRR